MAGGKSSGKKVAIADRRREALELRKAGASYRAIAKQISEKFSKLKNSDEALVYPNGFKYTESQAYNDVAYCLKEINEKSSLVAEEYRGLELERLDTAQLAIATMVRNGHLGSIDRWLRIAERRAKLLGLDAPERIKVTAEIDKELERTIDYLESRLPAEVFNQVIAVLSDDDATSQAD